MKTVKNLLNLGEKQLGLVSDNALKESQILLGFVLKKDRLWILTHSDDRIDEYGLYLSYLNRRSKNEPIEYITNEVSFYSEVFFIDYNALIPRPETELLIDEALKYIKSGDIIAEVGVGSGVISIILAKKHPANTIIASDISKNALEIAQKNIDRFNIKNIYLKHTSLLDGIEEKIDIIVSNPPYIKEGEKVDKNLDYEPQNALYGGLVGDEIIHLLIREAKIQKVKYLICEMGYNQKNSIINYCTQILHKSLVFYKDYADLDRGFILEF
jgi:release factor glutamine methyltransferase